MMLPEMEIKMPKSIIPGDRVKFSAEFCRNTGQYTGWTPFARGVVKDIERPGKPRTRSESFALAHVKWDDGTTTRVNVANLIGEHEMELG